MTYRRIRVHVVPGPRPTYHYKGKGTARPTRLPKRVSGQSLYALNTEGGHFATLGLVKKLPRVAPSKYLILIRFVMFKKVSRDAKNTPRLPTCTALKLEQSFVRAVTPR